MVRLCKGTDQGHTLTPHQLPKNNRSKSKVALGTALIGPLLSPILANVANASWSRDPLTRLPTGSHEMQSCRCWDECAPSVSGRSLPVLSWRSSQHPPQRMMGKEVFIRVFLSCWKCCMWLGRGRPATAQALKCL